MTTYTARRLSVQSMTCCATCEQLPVCAVARRTKHIINDDKRNDCNNDFVVWADSYIKGLFGDGENV